MPGDQLVIIIGGTFGEDDATGLAPVLCDALSNHSGLVTCDVSQLRTPDLGTIDALCRLQLAVRRHGGRVNLRGASADLVALLRLTGLEELFVPSVAIR